MWLLFKLLQPMERVFTMECALFIYVLIREKLMFHLVGKSHDLESLLESLSWHCAVARVKNGSHVMNSSASKRTYNPFMTYKLNLGEDVLLEMRAAIIYYFYYIFLHLKISNKKTLQFIHKSLFEAVEYFIF